MPRTADDQHGVGNQAPRNGRKTVETILADADEREPFVAGPHAAISGLSSCAS